MPRCVPSILAPIPSSAIEYPLDFTENRDRERNWSDRILRNAGIPGVEGAYRRLFFFMLSCLIFKSNVDRGIPSLTAAPPGPATFPLLSARAASMSSFS